MTERFAVQWQASSDLEVHVEQRAKTDKNEPNPCATRRNLSVTQGHTRLEYTWKRTGTKKEPNTMQV